MKTQFLSQEERKLGKKNYFSFTLFNELGFGFLADTTIYLLAIYFGASNIQLGYISSLMYLSGVVLIITPKIAANKNLIKTFFWTWFFRGAVCLINVIVLFTTNQIAVAIILFSYTLFSIFRMIGVSLSNPVIQSVSTPSDLGSVLTHNSGGLVSDAKIPVSPGFQVQFSSSIRKDVGISTGAVGFNYICFSGRTNT